MEQHKCVPVCLLGAQNVLEVRRDYYFYIKEKVTIVLRISNACLKVYEMAFEIFLLMRQNDTEINCCLLDCFSPQNQGHNSKGFPQSGDGEWAHKSACQRANSISDLTEGQMLQPGPSLSCKA